MGVVTYKHHVFIYPRIVAEILGDYNPALPVQGGPKRTGEEIAFDISVLHHLKLRKLIRKILPRLHRMYHYTFIEAAAHNKLRTQLFPKLYGYRQPALAVQIMSIFTNKQAVRPLS